MGRYSIGGWQGPNASAVEVKLVDGTTLLVMPHILREIGEGAPLRGASMESFDGWTILPDTTEDTSRTAVRSQPRWPGGRSPKPTGPKELSSNAIRKNFYETSDGIYGLMEAVRMEPAAAHDRLLIRHLATLEDGLIALQKYLNSYYNWD